MIKNAELIDSIWHADSHRVGEEVRISHIVTQHGVSTVRSVLPKRAQSEIYISGGLLSGANYQRFVGRAATRGFITRTLRHGSNSIHGAIESDADELAAAIELHAQDRPVHITAHSKGGPVAVRAAARLDSSINLKSLLLVNPAIVKTTLPNANGLIGATCEQIVCLGRLKKAAQGVWHEVTHRGLGVIGEVRDLFFGNDDISAELDALTIRGVHTMFVGGTFDHLVPASHTAAVLQKLHFDEVRSVDGPINGSHFGIMASDSFVDSLLPKDY